MAQLWFKFWAKEYLADTKIRCLNYEQRGILMALWAFAWEEGSIPADLTSLGNMLGLPAKAMRSHSEWITRFFVKDSNDAARLISPRLELDRMEADAKGSKARESAMHRWAKRNANASANASPDAMRTDMRLGCDDPCVSHAGQGQGQGNKKQLPPKPPSDPGAAAPNPASPPGAAGGEAVGASPQSKPRKRRTREEILAPFPQPVRDLVNILARAWHRSDPSDGREITIAPQEFGERVLQILQAHPSVTADLLLAAGQEYLASTRTRYKAPQHFFGPGVGNEGAPWMPYVRAILTRNANRPAEPEQVPA